MRTPRIRYALRRGRVRARVLLALASFRRAYLSDLAHAAGCDAQRAYEILHGGASYRADLSLVALALARPANDGPVPAYEITALGEVVAEGLRAHLRSFYAP